MVNPYEFFISTIQVAVGTSVDLEISLMKPEDEHRDGTWGYGVYGVRVTDDLWTWVSCSNHLKDDFLKAS